MRFYFVGNYEFIVEKNDLDFVLVEYEVFFEFFIVFFSDLFYV